MIDFSFWHFNKNNKNTFFIGKVERQKSSDKTLSKAPSIETKKQEK